jgi:hypothetical protein
MIKYIVLYNNEDGLFVAIIIYELVIIIPEHITVTDK